MDLVLPMWTNNILSVSTLMNKATFRVVVNVILVCFASRVDIKFMHWQRDVIWFKFVLGDYGGVEILL
jgi:hypothetical protein